LSGTHAGAIWGVKVTGKPGEVRDFAVWRFGDGKVVEISTIQDLFALLKQIGYLREETYAAYPAPLTLACGPPRAVRTCTGGRRPGRDLERAVAMSTQQVGWRWLPVAAIVAMNAILFAKLRES
jgi:SnoaL-like polyketide cyclase